jgi:hypothetical protein
VASVPYYSQRELPQQAASSAWPLQISSTKTPPFFTILT